MSATSVKPRVVSPALQAATKTPPKPSLEEVKAQVTQSKAPPSPRSATAVPRPAPPTPGTGSLGEPRVPKKIALARAVPVPRKPTRDERVNELSLMQVSELSKLVTKHGLDHTLDKDSKIKAILQAEYHPAGHPTVAKPQSIAKTRTPEEIQAEVDTLLDELRAATDPERKKGIRRALRLRGHRGGLKGATPAPQ